MDELLNGTLTQALEKLAAFAAYHRTGPVEKTAAGDWLASLGDTVKNNPSLSHALLGGGLGAAAMGAHTAFQNAGQDPSRKKSILGSMATGGMLGAGAGAGIGLARQGMAGMRANDGLSPTAPLGPGQYTDPATGQRMQVDPQALKDNPGLHEQVRSLTTPSLQSQAAGAIGGAYDFVRSKVPTTAPLVGMAGAADFAMHNPMFGLSRIRPQQAGGQIGKELFQYGLKGNDEVSGALRQASGTVPSTDPAPTTGTDTHVRLNDQVNPTNFLRRNYERLKGRLGMTPNQPTLSDILGGRGGKLDGSREVATVSYTPEQKGKRVIDTPDGKVEHEEVTHGPRQAKGIREGDVGKVKMFGHEQHPQLKDRQLFRTLGKTYAGAKSLPAAVASRAALYGTPLGAEYLYRGVQEDAQNQQTMRDIMARYAKPVQGGK